ncbi:MAG: energy transducer TonB [Pseudomonadota bacterium]
MPRSPGVLAAVLLAHAAVLGLMLTQARAPQPAPQPAPLFVRLIEPAVPPQATPVAPLPSPPTPPRPAPPRQPAPALTATPPLLQPSALVAPAPRPPEPAAESPRADAAPSPAPAPVEAPRPAPLVQPRFNADYLDNPEPPYPAISRRMGEEGEVRLRVLVDPGGNAQRVEIERSSGYPRLDQAALDTVKRWRFVPARQGDQPVAAWVIVPIQFTLRS